MPSLNFLIASKYMAGKGVKRGKKDIQDLDRTAKATSKTGGGLFNMTTLLKGGLGLAAVGASAAISGLAVAVASSTRKAMDLESQMSEIASVMGKSRKEIEPLQDLILKLGLDPNLKVDAGEAADAIQMLARNGLSMSEIMDGAARNTVLLANATGADFGTAADIATDVMSLFNIEAKDMKDAVDGITSVTTNSKFTIDDYALALAQGGGVASTVGVSFDDFNATIAAISPLFASGSDAGTSFKTMLQAMIPKSNAAEDAMRELGIITEDGQNKFFTASGEMRSMSEIAGILNEAIGGLSDEQKNQALSTIFGSDAMRAAAGIANLTEKDFLDLKKTMGNVDAEKSAATRMDNLKGSMEILSGIVDTLQLRIGAKFVPVLKKMVDAFAAFLDKHADKIVTFFDHIVGGVDLAADAITKFVEGGSIQLPSLASVGQMAVDGLIASIDGLGKATPMAIEKITDIIVGMVDWVFEKGIPMLVNAMTNIGPAVADAFGDDGPETPGGKILKAYIDAVNAVALAMIEAGGRIAWSIVSGFLKAFGLADDDAILAFKNFAKDTWNSFKNFMGGDGGDKFKEMGKNIMNGLKAGIDSLKQTLTDHFNGVATSLKESWGVWSKSTMRDKGQNLMNGLKEGVDHVASGLTGHFASVASGLRTSFGGWNNETMKTKGRNLMNGLRDGINEVGDILAGHFPSVAKVLSDALSSPFDYEAFKSFGRDVMNGLKDGINEKINSVKNAISDGLNGVIDRARGILDLFSPSRVFEDMGHNIMAGLSKGIHESTRLALNSVDTSLNAVIDGAIGAAVATGDTITDNSSSNNFNINFEGTSDGNVEDTTRLLNSALQIISVPV